MRTINWTKGSLGQFIELKRGYDLPTRMRTEGPCPVVSSSGISGSHVDSKVKGPGVVTGRYGTIGQVFFIEQDYWPLNTTLYVRDFKGNDPKFVSYLLRTIDFTAYTDKAAVPGVNRNHVHQTIVRFPPVGEQREIAQTLGTLDDKIELNRRMSRTLEAIAGAIFKSWFVDIESADGPGVASLPETGPLSKVATVQRELLDPSAFPDEIFDHHSIPAYDLDRRPAEDQGWAIRSSKFLVPPDSVLISKLNPRIPRVWLPIVSTARRSISSTEFVVLRPRPGFSREFLYMLVSTGTFLSELAQMVRGTSGSHQRVKVDDLMGLRVPLPDAEVVSAFTAAVSPMFELVRTKSANSLTLAELRDRLLPRLISGTLRPNARR